MCQTHLSTAQRPRICLRRTWLTRQCLRLQLQCRLVCVCLCLCAPRCHALLVLAAGRSPVYGSPSLMPGGLPIPEIGYGYSEWSSYPPVRAAWLVRVLVLAHLSARGCVLPAGWCPWRLPRVRLSCLQVLILIFAARICCWLHFVHCCCVVLQQLRARPTAGPTWHVPRRV
jgi:hypothetical protein